MRLFLRSLSVAESGGYTILIVVSGTWKATL